MQRIELHIAPSITLPLLQREEALENYALTLIKNKKALTKTSNQNDVNFLLEQIKDPTTYRPSRAKFYLKKQHGDQIQKTDLKTKKSKTHIVGSGRKNKLNANPNFKYSHTLKTPVSLLPHEPMWMLLFLRSNTKTGFLWSKEDCDLKSERYVFTSDALTDHNYWLKPVHISNNQGTYQWSSTIEEVTRRNDDAVKKKRYINWPESLVGLPQNKIDAIFAPLDTIESRLLALKNMYKTKKYLAFPHNIPVLVITKGIPHYVYSHEERIRDILTICKNKDHRANSNLYKLLTKNNNKLLRDIVSSSYLSICHKNKLKLKQELDDILSNLGIGITVDAATQPNERPTINEFNSLSELGPALNDELSSVPTSVISAAEEQPSATHLDWQEIQPTLNNNNQQTTSEEQVNADNILIQNTKFAQAFTEEESNWINTLITKVQIIKEQSQHGNALISPLGVEQLLVALHDLKSFEHLKQVIPYQVQQAMRALINELESFANTADIVAINTALQLYQSQVQHPSWPLALKSIGLSIAIAAAAIVVAIMLGALVGICIEGTIPAITKGPDLFPALDFVNLFAKSWDGLTHLIAGSTDAIAALDVAAPLLGGAIAGLGAGIAAASSTIVGCGVTPQYGYRSSFGIFRDKHFYTDKVADAVQEVAQQGILSASAT